MKCQKASETHSGRHPVVPDESDRHSVYQSSSESGRRSYRSRFSYPKAIDILKEKFNHRPYNEYETYKARTQQDR